MKYCYYSSIFEAAILLLLYMFIATIKTSYELGAFVLLPVSSVLLLLALLFLLLPASPFLRLHTTSNITINSMIIVLADIW